MMTICIIVAVIWAINHFANGGIRVHTLGKRQWETLSSGMEAGSWECPRPGCPEMNPPEAKFCRRCGRAGPADHAGGTHP